MEKLIFEQSEQIQKLTEVVTNQSYEISKLHQLMTQKCGQWGFSNTPDKKSQFGDFETKHGISKTPQVDLGIEDSLGSNRRKNSITKNIENIRSQQKRKSTSNKQIENLLHSNRKELQLQARNSVGYEKITKRFQNSSHSGDLSVEKAKNTPHMKGLSRFQIYNKTSHKLQEQPAHEPASIKVNIPQNPQPASKKRDSTFKPVFSPEVTLQEMKEENSIYSEESVSKDNMKMKDLGGFSKVKSDPKADGSAADYDLSQRLSPDIAIKGDGVPKNIFSSFNSDEKKDNNDDSYRELFSTPKRDK